jgi:hypothetical protein
MKTYAIAATTFLFWSTGSTAFVQNSRSVLHYRRFRTASDTVSPEALATDGPSKHHESGRKRWGIGYKSTNEYWFDQRIHNLGNIGVTGALHAAIAALATNVIDKVAYGGMDIRQEVSNHNNPGVL